MKHISPNCRYKFHGEKCNRNQKRNEDTCWCVCKRRLFETGYVWNPSAYAKFKIYFRSYTYMKSVIADSLVTFDGVADSVAKSYKDTPENFSINSRDKNKLPHCYQTLLSFATSA